MDHVVCPCKRTKCERYGKCDECRAHHHQMTGRKSLTRCEKLELKEQKKQSKQNHS